MDMTQLQNFWSEIGSTKDFTDPFFEDRFASFLSKDDTIIEYGCGYGRILNTLWEKGYTNLQGFDFAPKMISRGQSTYPHLNLHLINHNGHIPLPDQSVDGIILSTVLCCNPDKNDQKIIIQALYRVLKDGGILYLCDFLITRSNKYTSRYEAYAKPDEENYGIYLTNEGVAVRHHLLHWIFDLLKDFDIQWLEQLDYVTMNGNPVRTFHLIAQKQ